jgi:hypothetical protein
MAQFWNWENEMVCGMKLSLMSVTHPQLTRQAPEMEWKPSSSLCTMLRVGSNTKIWIAFQMYKCRLQCIPKLVCIYKWRLLFGAKITIFIGADSEHTCLLIVGGDKLAVFRPGMHSLNLKDIETSLAISLSRNLVSHLETGGQPNNLWARLQNWNGHPSSFEITRFWKWVDLADAGFETGVTKCP